MKSKNKLLILSVFVNLVLIGAVVFSYTGENTAASSAPVFQKSKRANLNRNQSGNMAGPGKTQVETDYKNAVEEAVKLRGKARADALQKIMVEWARHDYRAAWKWASNKEHFHGATDFVRMENMKAVSRELMKSNRMRELTECWDTVHSTTEQFPIFRDSINGLSMGNIKYLAQWAETSPAMSKEKSKPVLYEYLGSDLANTSPAAALDWAASLGAAEQDRVVGAIVKTVMRYDGLAEAVETIGQVAGSLETDEAISAIMPMTRDPQTLAALAESIENMELRDRAYSGAATVNGYANPQAAMQLANNISDHRQYMIAVDVILKMQSRKSPENALSALKEARNLSAEEVEYFEGKIRNGFK